MIERNQGEMLMEIMESCKCRADDIVKVMSPDDYGELGELSSKISPWSQRNRDWDRARSTLDAASVPRGLDNERYYEFYGRKKPFLKEVNHYNWLDEDVVEKIERVKVLFNEACLIHYERKLDEIEREDGSYQMFDREVDRIFEKGGRPKKIVKELNRLVERLCKL